MSARRRRFTARPRIRRLVLPAAAAALALPAATWFTLSTSAGPSPVPSPGVVDLELTADPLDSVLFYQVPDSILAEAYLGRVEEKMVEVQSGDTLMALLQSAGVGSQEAHTAITALSEIYSPRKLRPGQQIQVALMHEPPLKPNGEATSEAPKLSYISLRESPEADIRVERNGDGFQAETVARTLEREVLAARGNISSSLYAAALSQSVPDAIILETIRAYSYRVDFQRDPQRDDGFELVYERFLDDEGNSARSGDLLYASLSVRGTPLEIYRYTTQEGDTDYFTPEGESVRRLLMRTPIDGARISSGFGMRRHPIRGYSRMHRGTDFAAPPGTPIYAAGNGTVERADYFGSYGNYVRIRHNGEYATAYAHLQRFASSVSAGTRVQQGQVIGYVGSTGASTGPHLHYEVLVNGEQVDPQSVDLPTGITLDGPERERFMAHRREIDRLREEKLGPIHVAQQACLAIADDASSAEGAEAPVETSDSDDSALPPC